MLHQNSREEALILIYNDILNQLTLAAINLRFFEKEELLSSGINGELTKNVTHWRMNVTKLSAILEIINSMLSELKKIESKDKTTN